MAQRLNGEEKRRKMSSLIKCGNCKKDLWFGEEVLMVVCTCGVTTELEGGDEDGI